MGRTIMVGGSIEQVSSAIETDEEAARIVRLRDAAGEAGDLEQVALCERALLDGDSAALRACRRAMVTE